MEFVGRSPAMQGCSSRWSMLLASMRAAGKRWQPKTVLLCSARCLKHAMGPTLHNGRCQKHAAATGTGDMLTPKLCLLATEHVLASTADTGTGGAIHTTYDSTDKPYLGASLTRKHAR